jgi:hypothetical protein
MPHKTPEIMGRRDEKKKKKRVNMRSVRNEGQRLPTSLFMKCLLIQSFQPA